MKRRSWHEAVAPPLENGSYSMREDFVRFLEARMTAKRYPKADRWNG